MSQQPDSERNATRGGEAGDTATTATTTTIARALREAADALRERSVEEPRREAATLLAATTGRDRAFLVAHSDDALAPGDLELFRARVSRRAAGEPTQYITGRQEFYGLDFEVGPAVLIPRPETELLVETALELLRGVGGPRLCDVGTGSGCVAVALLHARTDARCVAVDISPDALRVAARNAARHSVTDRLPLVASDCFAALDPAYKFDLVASNPPYVAETDLDGLQREVREHEPRAALTPGGDGLSVIRRLLADAPRFLSAGGCLVFEIGHDQHEAVRRLIDARVWKPLGIRRDLQGIPRTVALRLKG
ncbi:MAG TPA: peptide chain release factor N(5)-glutamine methyltransferase [Pyrinomonadaceae bacterium]|jgi:release factor glutamine methyltransferase